MKKRKISEIALLSYLDGELNERDSNVVKEYLFQSEYESEFLEKICEVEKGYTSLQDNLISNQLESTIFQNAHDLLRTRREKINERKLKVEKIQFSLAFVQDLISNFKLPYEYIALSTLVIMVMSLLKTPTHQGNVIAFETTPQVVTAEDSQEDLMNKESF